VRERRQLAAWPRARAFARAGLSRTDLQPDHAPDQAAELGLDLVNTREATLQAHAFRIAGEHTGSHGVDQGVARFCTQAPPGEFGQRFVGFTAAGNERFAHHAQSPWQAHQAGGQEGRGRLGQSVQASMAVNVPYAGLGASWQSFQLQRPGEFQGFRLVVEEAVDPPLAGIAFRGDFGPDLAAGSVTGLDDLDVEVLPARPQGMGRCQAGNACAYDYNLQTGLLCHTGHTVCDNRGK
jgi:hypothetical protein